MKVNIAIIISDQDSIVYDRMNYNVDPRNESETDDTLAQLAEFTKVNLELMVDEAENDGRA